MDLRFGQQLRGRSRQAMLGMMVGLIISTLSTVAQANDHEPSTLAVDAVSELDATKQAAVPSACVAQLERNISAIINQSAYRSGKWGVHVERLGTGEVLYSHNANQYLIPASNIKLFTTAAALQLYDPRSPIDSSTLGSWVQTINQRSHNGYADSLLKRIGGQAAVRQSLGRLGVTDGYRQADGSGLSRQNAVTSQAVVQLLQVMDYAYGQAVFYRSLPVAGQSGTLTRRFRSTRAQGIVRAKTGTLRGVRALSGYLEHPLYGRIVFSILVNQPGQSGQTLLNGIDNIVLQMANLSNCYPA